MAVDRGAGDDRNETTGPTGNGRRVNGWYDTASYQPYDTASKWDVLCGISWMSGWVNFRKIIGLQVRVKRLRTGEV